MNFNEWFTEQQARVSIVGWGSNGLIDFNVGGEIESFIIDAAWLHNGKTAEWLKYNPQKLYEFTRQQVDAGRARRARRA